MNGDQLPVAEALRTPGRTLLDSAIWVIRKCPYCRRKHHHTAPATMLELVLLPPCPDGRAYRVREVS